MAIIKSRQAGTAINQVAPLNSCLIHPYNNPKPASKCAWVKDVKKIQTLLALLKFNPGPIDGILGQKTTKAIRAFQLDIGVPVTGKIDKNLKSQLDRAYRLSSE